jgi:serine/threonine protein kinase
VRARSEVTQVGTLKGKLSYMSPEQSVGDPVDGRSDIFSLGVVLHECLTGKRLFRGHDDFHTLRLIKDARVSPPSELAPEVEPELDQIVLRMLARDRSERYQSCEEVVAALAPVIHRLHADATQLRAFMETREPAPRKNDELSDTSTTPGRRRPNTEPAARPPRNGTLRWQLALVTLSCVLFAVSAWISHRRSYKASHVPAAAAPTAPAAGTSPAELPVPAESPAPPEPASADTVQLRISGVNGAQVFLDGLDVGRIPLELSLPSKPGHRKVSVRRPGYATFTEVVAADDNAIVTAHLRPLAARPPKLSPGDIKNPFAH